MALAGFEAIIIWVTFLSSGLSFYFHKVKGDKGLKARSINRF
jgi:hypothetical protein